MAAPTLPFTGTQLKTDLDKKYIYDIQTLSYAASISLDFNNPISGFIHNLSLTGDVSLTTANIVSGCNLVIIIRADGTERTLTFPAGWKFGDSGNSKPATIAANAVGILSVTFTGTTDADGLAAYALFA